MKGSSSRKKEDHGTWTLRPDDDVRRAVGDFLKHNRDYDRTRIVNEAIRLRLADAIESILFQQRAEIESRLAALKRQKPFNSLKTAKKEVVGSVLARVAELARNKRR